MDDFGVEVSMSRYHMRDLPQYDFPQGFGIRSYRQGEKHIWTRIRDGDTGGWCAHRFEDPEILKDRIFFLTTDEGEEIGTVTVWWKTAYTGRIWGLIESVEIHPDFRGRGLGKAMMSVAMQRVKRSHDCCMVGTETGRLAAIKIYLDFGFYPDLYDDSLKASWAPVASVLNHPVLKSCGL